MGKEILNAMAVFTEAFDQIDISDDEFLTIANRIDFIHIFDDIKDFRQQGKAKYKLQNLLFLTFLVKLREKTNSFTDIAAYIKIYEKQYTEYGLIENGECPSHDTLRRVMMGINSETLYRETTDKFYKFLRELEEEIRGSKYKHLAIDGKSVNGSGRGDDTKNPLPNTQLLNVYDSGLATCISCEKIDDKTNEIPVGQELIRDMELKKTVVTADALHCQKETASIIHNAGGVYVITTKENQKSLYEEILSRFEKYENKIKHHIREKRIIDIVMLPQNYATDGFKGMKSFVRMKSKAGGKKTTTTRYFISNTKNEELICEAIEARWSVENSLHKEKDVFFYEDNITFTNKNAVHNMAILNNLAVQLCKIYQSFLEPDLAMAKRTVHAFPVESLSKILAFMTCEELTAKLKEALRKYIKK